MTDGSVVYLFCDVCEDETPHRILKGKLGPSIDAGFDGTVQCHQCGSTHSAHIDVERPIEVNCILSKGESSEKTKIEFFPKEMVKVSDEFIWDDHNLLITSIEMGDKRVGKAEASEISCLWLKYFDTLEIKVAIVEGSNTKSEKVFAAPDEEFRIGDLLEFGRVKVVITKIKSTSKMVYSENSPVEARSIKRIYSKRVNERRY